MRTRQLFLIRIALVTGVTAFAVLAAYQRMRIERAELDVTLGGAMLPLDLLRYVLWGLCGAAIAGALLLRSRFDAAPPNQRVAFLVVGWALGEGVALFGTVQYFAGADLSALVLGLLAFVTVLMILPIPPERG